MFVSAGPSGMLARADGPLDGVIAEIFVSVPAQSIAGRTDEIQRNILGERSLGLPKEPEQDADSVNRPGGSPPRARAGTRLVPISNDSAGSAPPTIPSDARPETPEGFLPRFAPAPPEWGR